MNPELTYSNGGGGLAELRLSSSRIYLSFHRWDLLGMNSQDYRQEPMPVEELKVSLAGPRGDCAKYFVACLKTCPLWTTAD